MDDNLDLDSSDPFMSKGHSDNGEINQSDLLNNQMANQQVPGYADDYHSDETDNSLLHGQNQSSFIPPYTGKELVDSSLSDSNRDWEQEDDMMFNQGSSDPLVKGSVNQFQPDLLNMNPLSLESKSSHEETSFRDDFFAPNNLSEKPIAQTGYEEHVPSSQPPDLLMMESSASHTEVTEGYEQTVKTFDTDLKSCGETDLKSCDDLDLHTQSIPHDRHEAIENDFYNENENADHYDDEYVDSDESDYTDESMDKMEGQTGLEHIVPDICDTEEKQQPVEIEDTENALNNSVDPNIGASGITQKDSDYLKNVQFEDNVVHSQLSDEENGNMAVQASQPAFTNSEHLDLLKQEEKESLGSDSEDEFESATPQQIASKESNENKVDLISDQQAIEGTSDIALNNKDIPIESDDSDMEERSLTPDPNQSSRMETGPPFHVFVGGQSTDQVQISGLVEGTLMEESESTDDEEPEQQCQVPLEQFPGSAAMTMEQTQQIDNNFVTKSEHVDQFDLQKGHTLEGLSENGEKHFEESFEQSHSFHEQQEIEKQNSFDNQDLEQESRMQHEQLNETKKIDYLVSDELEISHQHEEGLLTESSKTESNAGLEMATNLSVEPTLSEIPSSEEVHQQTLLSTETLESQNIGQDVENNEIKGTLDKDVEQVDTKPDILECSDESEVEIDDDKIQNEQSGMDGSIVMEEGETLDDKKMEESISSEGEEESLNNDSLTSNMMENNKDLQTEQEISSFQPANYSTDLQMPASQLPEPGVEASIIPDEANKGQISDRNEPVQLSPDNSSDEEEIPANQMRETGMEGSFVLDKDETFEDKQFDGDDAEFVQSTPETSPEDEIPANQMSEPIILDEDKKYGDEKTENKELISDVSKNDDIQANQMRESGMEGSFVLEEGETFDDNKYAGDVDEFVQSTPEISPEEEQIPQSQMRETGMEGSLVLDEGETFEDKKHERDQAGFEHDVNEFEQTSPEISPEEEQIPQSQMRETGMEGSLVLDEGETFDDKNYDGDDGEFEQSTPEVSPEDEVPVHQMRESGMEGSFVLEEGETFDDKQFESDMPEFEQSTPEVSPEEEIPANQKRETGMEGSFVFDEGETFEGNKVGNDEDEFEQSTPEDDIQTSQLKTTGMDDSAILDKCEQFDDTTDEPSIQGHDLSSDQRVDIESFVAPVGGQTMDDGSEAVNYSEESIQFKESVEEEMKPLVSIEKEEPDSDMENQDKKEETTYSLEPADGKTIEGHLVEDSMSQQIEEVTSAETPTDSYGEEGDVDSAIQSPLSQNDMLQSPSSDENAQLYVEHENEKNLMSSSLTGEFVDQDEAIQTYQPCMQNGVSHSASEEVTPEKEENEHPCFQNGISQSTSDEFTPEREEKTDFNLTEKEGKQEIVTKIETKSELKDSIAKSEVNKKTGIMKTEVKRIEQSSPKKTLKLTKPDSQKKDITKETKKITKDTTRKKDTLSKLPSPTKTEKRSMSTSRLTTPPTRTDKPATRMPRDTTRKPRPASTTEPAKQTKQRPKSIDISRTSSLTRPTKSSLCKSRTFEKSALEGASSPTKPLRSVPKTAPSRYRITRSKKDASSDSGVEEDKSPRKTETQKKSQDDKMTRSTSAKRSTIPTMNRSQPTKSEESPRKTAGKPTPTKTTQSKIGSLDNTKYSPGGGQVKIQSQKQDFSKVSSKIGSKDYLTHKPAGGEKKILSQKLEWKAESKVGSLKNATYSPRGGNVKIQTEKLAWNVQSKVGSLDNASHSPGGGHVKIENKKLDFKDKAQSKVGSKDHMNHKAGGGDKKIESQKLMFKEKAQSKVGSKDNIDHKPLGGDKKIDTQKLTFKETAKPRTDTGVAPGKSRPDSGIECEKTEASV